ncbi:MAG: NAD(P)-binding domain-containing protein [Acidimicrobiales bacterium]|jgi:hypothetical protein|nr:NAD(P)-binding domain-containing protein [Acidimicrobiales bacterium]
MKIAIIGVGNVGRALGQAWATRGHEVVYGVRDPGAERHRALLEASPGASSALPAEAAAGVDVVVLATPWASTLDAARALGDLGGAVLVDATNPLVDGDVDPGVRSGGEAVAAAVTDARLVKAFNATGSANMADASYGATRPMLPLAGDDAAAKTLVAGLAAELGFDPVDCGGLAASRELEHLALTWIRLAYALGNGPGIAFALLRR